MRQHVGEAFIVAQHREHVDPLTARVFKIVYCLFWDMYKIATFGLDCLSADMEDHRTTQDEEQLSGVVMRMRRYPIAGVMNLQKYRAPTHLWVAEQGHAAMVIRAQLETLQLLRVVELRQHRDAFSDYFGLSTDCYTYLSLATGQEPLPAQACAGAPAQLSRAASWTAAMIGP